MNKKEIEKEYKKKVSKLKKYNKSYYLESQSIISDKGYDDLKNEVLKLEANYKFLSSNYSPSKVVGYKPSKTFRKVEHRVPMLSLSNAFSEEDLNNFEKKIFNFPQKKMTLKLHIVLS